MVRNSQSRHNHSFRQALLNLFAPRLKTLGYVYDDALKEGNAVYGFHKHLGNDVRTIVLFVRRLDKNERAYGYGFEVKLGRAKTSNIARWNEGGYEGAVAPELSHLLWLSYGLRIYPDIHYVWEPDNPEALEVAFNDVLDKLERYGLPWLENLQSRVAEPLRLGEWNEFQQALWEIMPPELEALGYEMKEDTRQQWIPSRGKPQYHFVKTLGDHLRTFVIFHPFGYLYWRAPDAIFGFDNTPDLTYFDVLLFRKRSVDPHDQNWVSDGDCFETWLSQHLMGGADLNYQGPSPSPLWKYTNREELIAQLKDALDKLKQYGIPLLEDPRTKNPRLHPTNS